METQFDLLLKGGYVIDPANNINQVMDVAVSGKRIAAVAPDLDPKLAARVVDAAQKYTRLLIDTTKLMTSGFGQAAPGKRRKKLSEKL